MTVITRALPLGIASLVLEVHQQQIHWQAMHARGDDKGLSSAAMSTKLDTSDKTEERKARPPTDHFFVNIGTRDC